MRELQRRGDPHVVIALAANKADKEDKRKVTIEEGEEYARENGIIHMQVDVMPWCGVRAVGTHGFMPLYPSFDHCIVVL